MVPLCQIANIVNIIFFFFYMKDLWLYLGIGIGAAFIYELNLIHESCKLSNLQNKFFEESWKNCCDSTWQLAMLS